MNALRPLLIAAALLAAAPCGLAQEDAAFAPLRAFLDRSIEDGSVAGGSVLVFHKGAVAFHAGFGFADLASRKPFTADTPVVIASISKPLLATALYRLVESGKLDPALPITAYLPEFSGRKLASGEEPSRAPTFTELLTHTAGLRGDKAPEGRLWFQDWTRGKTLAFVVSKVAEDIPFATHPGTRHSYSGIGTDVAARIGEVVSGLPRNEYFSRLLCEPLGMKSTFYQDVKQLGGRGLSMPTRYSRNETTGKLTLYRGPPAPEPLQYSSSGGSIVSTPQDLLRWLCLFRNRGVHEGTAVLSPDTIKRLLAPHSLGANAAGGLFVQRKSGDGTPTRFGHTGSSGTSVWIDLESDTVGILLTQTSNLGPFRLSLEKLISDAVSGLKK